MKSEKFVPYEKLNKKARKALNQKKRSDWGNVRPATQIEENKKSYQRHEKHRKRAEYLYA